MTSASTVRRFLQKRAVWLEWMDAKDPHSIPNQIQTMIWRDVLFRTINDLRRQADGHPKEGVAFNSDVLELIDIGFVATQTLAIRRLTDTKSTAISLRRLLEDIERHRELITRENYVTFDGVPYDATQCGTGVPQGGWVESTGPSAWAESRLRHSEFDEMAGVLPEARDASDLIPRATFKHLRSCLRKCDDVRTYADRFVAHAATRAERDKLCDSDLSITLDKLASNERAICRVFQWVSSRILGAAYTSMLLVPQYDHLNGLDKAWVSSEDVPLVEQSWTKNARGVEQWTAESPWDPE